MIIFRAALQLLLVASTFNHEPITFGDVVAYSLVINFVLEAIPVFSYFLLFVLVKKTLSNRYPTAWNYLWASILTTIPNAILWDLSDFNFLFKIGRIPFAEIVFIQKAHYFQYLSFLLFSIAFYMAAYWWIEHPQNTKEQRIM